MAMLAGPRRKQKVVNLRAKNSAWSNDSEKFGQRMLERMGWSSGKGLGAREDGIVEHVIARYKNDECGLGYEDKSDQWTQHEDDYSALLAGLANSGGAEAEPAPATSGVSLEALSKRSRARVHYHKFTRGKDLSRYSQKDLANIFGKKSLEKTSRPLEEQQQEERPQSTALFTRGGDMNDYFSKKLKILGRSTEQHLHDDHTAASSLHNANTEDRDNNLNCRKKKKKSKQISENGVQHYMEADAEGKDISELPQTMEHVEIETLPQDNNVQTQKSKKKKKNKRDVTVTAHGESDDASQNVESCSVIGNGIVESLENNSIAPKKKKKGKSKTALSEYNTVEEAHEKPATGDLGNTKKKSKRKQEQVEDVSQTLEEKESLEDQPRKKKKDKRKHL